MTRHREQAPRACGERYHAAMPAPVFSRCAFHSVVVAALGGAMALTGCHRPGSLSDLQRRVDAASPGASIDLPPGNWSGDVVVRRPLTVRGAGWDRTTLSGARALTVESKGVTFEEVSIHGSEAGV